jgi:hypothetical protein
MQLPVATRRWARAQVIAKPTATIIAVKIVSRAAAGRGPVRRGGRIFYPNQMHHRIEVEQRHFLRDQGFNGKQKIIILLVEEERLRQPLLLGLGDRGRVICPEAGSSVQAVIRKHHMSALLAISVPNLSTHAEEPRKFLAVLILHATGGTSTTSR